MLQDQSVCILPHGPPENVLMTVSWDCHGKLSQTWWLKITEMYSLTYLEAGSSKSRCQQDRPHPEGSGGASFLFCFSFCQWPTFTCPVPRLCLLVTRPPLFFRHVPLTRTLSCNPGWSLHLRILNLSISAKTVFFPNKVTFMASGDQVIIISLGATIQPTTRSYQGKRVVLNSFAPSPHRIF